MDPDLIDPDLIDRDVIGPGSTDQKCESEHREC